MSGGQRYWNEDAQRWEDGDGGGTRHSATSGGGDLASTPPPTPPPTFPPSVPPTLPPSVPPTLPPPSPSPSPESVPTAPDAAPATPWVQGPDGSWSGPELPAPHAPGERGLSRRTLWTVLGGAAAAGVAVALVLTLVVGDDTGPGPDDDRGDGKVAASSPDPGPETSAPPPTEETEPTGTVTPSAEVPAGYELYDDAEGFTVARPLGWTREAVDSQYGMDVVNYRSADGERRLQVFEVAETSPEESFELFLSDDTPKADGFRELSLENLDDSGHPGSRLAYLADSIKGEPDVGPWHVVDERFEAEDGRIYAIAAYGPDADGREDEHELLRTARAHFCPPYHSCGESAWFD
ncbi:MAG: hypothetical protein H5T76_27100 [Streptomyces sp.]|nr:hypothetical protein [Streptomyces sp.]